EYRRIEIAPTLKLDRWLAASSFCSPDRRSPVCHFFGRHRSRRPEPGVVVAPDANIRQILLTRKQSPETCLPIRRHALELINHAFRKLRDNPARNLRTLRWINKSKCHDMTEKHAPVISKTAQQPRPVHRFTSAANQVRDVRSVKSLALLHVSLRPDHLLG